MFLVAELFEQPASDPILLFRRQLGQFRKGCFKYLGHNASLPNSGPTSACSRRRPV